MEIKLKDSDKKRIDDFMKVVREKVTAGDAVHKQAPTYHNYSGMLHRLRMLYDGDTNATDYITMVWDDWMRDCELALWDNDFTELIVSGEYVDSSQPKMEEHYGYSNGSSISYTPPPPPIPQTDSDSYLDVLKYQRMEQALREEKYEALINSTVTNPIGLANAKKSWWTK